MRPQVDRDALEREGQALRERRKRAGKSLEDVAGELGVSRQTVRAWETGDFRPSEVNRQGLDRSLGPAPVEGEADVGQGGEERDG